MKVLEVTLRKNLKILTDCLAGLTAQEDVCFFFNNKALNYLREVANVKAVSDLLEIQCSNFKIIIGPHTSGWWRIYWITGKVSFNEPSNPERVVFLEVED